MNHHPRVDAPRQRARAARQRIITAANRALAVLEHEDPASPVTASYDPGGSSSGDSPTESQALHDIDDGRDSRRHLRRIASGLEKHAAAFDEWVEALVATRTPSEPCGCCGDELATHTRRVNGETLDVCTACHDYHRAHGHLCNVDSRGNPTDVVHRNRPRIRWCDCPTECCPNGCPDRAAEGRKVSERCRSRMRRRDLDQPATASEPTH